MILRIDSHTLGCPTLIEAWLLSGGEWRMRPDSIRNPRRAPAEIWIEDVWLSCGEVV